MRKIKEYADPKNTISWFTSNKFSLLTTTTTGCFVMAKVEMQGKQSTTKIFLRIVMYTELIIMVIRHGRRNLRYRRK